VTSTTFCVLRPPADACVAAVAADPDAAPGEAGSAARESDEVAHDEHAAAKTRSDH
jgi:hypothetical protein